jgi:hypothetical protein
MSRVECSVDPELDTYYPRRWPARVKIESKAGSVFSVEVMFPKGDPENPLTLTDPCSLWKPRISEVIFKLVISMPNKNSDESMSFPIAFLDFPVTLAAC